MHANPLFPTGRMPACGCANNSNASSCADSSAPVPDGVFTCNSIWHTAEQKKSYIAQVEKFTVHVQHAIITLEGDDQAGAPLESKEMDGFLLSNSDSLCKDGKGLTKPKLGSDPSTSAPCYRPTKTDLDYYDYFTVEDLLVSTNMISLPINASTRSTGLHLTLQIDYSNYEPWVGVVDQTSYVYHVHVANREAKFTSTDNIDYPGTRWLFVRNGFAFSATQAGNIGQFSFSTLLQVLTASLTLLAVSVTLVRLLAQNVLANKNYYRSAIQEYSPDFSEISGQFKMFLEEMPVHDLQELVTKHWHPDESKDRYDLIMKLCNNEVARAAARQDLMDNGMFIQQNDVVDMDNHADALDQPLNGKNMGFYQRNNGQ